MKYNYYTAILPTEKITNEEVLIEKDGNRQRNATIQDEEITISRTSYKAHRITATTDRRKYRRQKILCATKKYNGTDKQHWRQALPTKDSSWS